MEHSIDGVDRAAVDRAISLLNAATFVEGTAPSYDAISDSILWKDEFPQMDPDSDLDVVLKVIRPLWWHRTQQILGRPTDKYQRLWNLVLQHAPNWAGFTPHRCASNESLAALHRDRSQAFVKDFDSLLD